ncbi:hypothetical protein ABPG72_010980 [Tetrahymena utriculariae]
MIKLFNNSLKSSLRWFNLSNVGRFQFAFNPQKVIQDSAKFELETSQLPNGQQITDKLYDLTVKLENQSPFNESEKAMITMMTLADYNMKFKNIELSDKIFTALSNHLEEYQDNNMAFYQYLNPSIFYRKALMIEEKIQNANNNTEHLEQQILEMYKQVASMIEEYTEFSETLIEENVHLLAKVYEKLGNVFKKKQNFEEAVKYYQKGIKVGQEVYHKNGVYLMKMNCLVGDLLSRSEQNYESSIQYLQTVLDNITIKTPQDAQIFSIASSSILKVHLNYPQTFKPELTKQLIEKIEQVIQSQDKDQKLITPLSRSVILTMKAENQLKMNEKEKARSTFDDSLALALKVFPPNHSFVQNIFKKMQQL